MVLNTIHRKPKPPLPLPMLLAMVVYCLFGASVVRIDGFVPASRPALVSTNGRLQGALRERRQGICLQAFFSADGENNNQSNNDDDNRNSEEDNQQEHTSNFFFDMGKTNIDARSSMDAGIYDLLGSSRSSGLISSEGTIGLGGGENIGKHNHPSASMLPSSQSSAVVVIDWECLLDAIPYHIELGIHAARTTWPHLNDLCNFDTDREWLENKLFAMSHVLGSPEGPDKSRHIACEYALATRLILEEQALDRNESTGKNGKYARKFHPRSEINGSNDFEKDQSRSRRPLTAGELAVNWREFIRSTLIVKYSRGPDGRMSKQEPMEALEQGIEEYLSKPSKSAAASPRIVSKSLPLFPQTKFALKNSSRKLVVRISHKFDNEIVSRSLNKKLQLLPHERIAKTYKPENAIRRLFLHSNKSNSKNENNSKNIVLLLKPDSRYDIFNPNEAINNKSMNDNASLEKCLKDIMKFTHRCDNSLATEDHPEPTTPSVVWIDSSWHRLQGLAPVFGDTIPGGRNGNRNTAKCSFAKDNKDKDTNNNDESGAESDDEDDENSVWLSLWLAEWPSQETSGYRKSKISSSSSSENHEAAMVYPWTDSLSWETAEDILIPVTWGSSDNAFQ